MQVASLSKSKSRLVVETSDYSLLFNGTISKGGKCEIPIRKLKGLIDEDTTGNIRLEVIAEDTFFTPWESKFEVQKSKKVTVEVKTQEEKPIIKESKIFQNIENNSHMYFVHSYEFIPKDKIIWEAFYGDGESAKIWKRMGYNSYIRTTI